MILSSPSKCRTQSARVARGRARFSPFAALVFAIGVAAAGSSGCEDKGIGRMCDAANDAGAGESVPNTAALECPSRICLKQGAEPGATSPGTGALCSAECSSDKDCEDAEIRPSNADGYDKRCRSGFFCGVPLSVGSLACQKLCVCKDFYKTTTSGGFQKPPIPVICANKK